MASPKTPTPRGSTWKEWVEKHPSGIIVNKQAQGKLYEAFNHTVSSEKCRESLLSNQAMSFLIKESFGKTRVAIVHHLAKVGGTIYDDMAHYGMIQGITKDMAVHLTPDMETMCANHEGAATPVPTITNLAGITKEEDIGDLAVGARTTFRARNFIPIVPFLLNDINEAILKHQGKAKQVLLAVVQSIKKFDTEHGDNEDYKEKAKHSCKDVLDWLYLVGMENPAVAATPTTSCSTIGVITTLRGTSRLGIGKTKIIDFTSKRTGMTDSTQASMIQKPLEMIATSTSSNQEFLRKLTQMQQAATTDKAAKSFQKLPDKYRKMILIASSMNEVTIAEANPRAMEFFKSTSTLY